MNRMVLGAVSALLMAAAGIFWWQGRAALERGAPPPELSGQTGNGGEIELPTADPHGRGAALPGGAKRLMSKEEKRFNRYDRNKDGQIIRNEMLATRVTGFKKLDINRDNLLSFEEWAVKTANRFKEVDKNGDGIVTRAELDGYMLAKDNKPKRASCACGPAPKAAKGVKPNDSDDDGDPTN
ncbi:MAG: hypothetical protein RLY97_763 [Pseudomonadota bacterium]|jgi:hypothetical protein